ncbi:MAG TPA: molybdate ABC transporter substrate-binding protein [Micropepsaceae bacterium]|nr:molybdate ABC transporter substrate-binding protein [Micropepsaceae bacterium]
MWKISLLALAVSAPFLALPARAAELTIFATGSMADPLKEVGEDFTHQTGHTLRFSLGTTGGVLNKLKAGEKGDVIVISDEAAVELERDGKIVPGSRKDLASSLFGVVVKAGAPTPDISSPEALKKTVLAARSISYPDPVVAAASGGYIESVFQGMGIKDEAKKKAALKPMGVLVGEAVAKGEAELGLSFVSEFVADKSLKVVMFPGALQKPQLYTAGVFAGSPNADAARAFIAFVTSPAARAKLKAAGVDPVVAGR